MIKLNITSENIEIRNDKEEVLGKMNYNAYFMKDDIDRAILDAMSITLESLGLDYEIEVESK